MKTIDVQVVRIYITEASHLLNKMITYLKKDIKIRGVTVFRAISGFSGDHDHSANLVDLSLSLPLTIEFFDDDKNKIEQALNYLSTLMKAEHIVFWDAKANI